MEKLPSCAILLGAGASIDAGLPSAFSLTDEVYQELKSPSYGKQGMLFGYVISKLQGRRVLNGGSPFDPINIEDAYDAVLRLFSRDQDILSEFVYSWDPILDALKAPFDEERFARALAESVVDQSRNRSAGSHLSINSGKLREAAKVISAAFGSGDSIGVGSSVSGIYIDILIGILSRPSENLDYLEGLAEFSSKSGSVLATLNYDILMETALKNRDLKFSYGLDFWNERQVIKWPKNAAKILKLHGSINWTGGHDKIEVSDEPVKSTYWKQSKAVLVFGGQASKLDPDGPFLQLRHHFEEDLMKRDRLLVIGYSFQDRHINALLKRWVATRKRAKFVIVNPSGAPLGHPLFRGSYRSDSGGVRKIVDIQVVKKGARAGWADAIRLLNDPINLAHDKTKNGLLPNMLVNVTE